MKPPIRSAGDGTDKLLRVGRKEPANRAALQVLEEAAAYVRAHPEVESLMLMVGSPGRCQPFATPIERPPTSSVCSK